MTPSRTLEVREQPPVGASAPTARARLVQVALALSAVCLVMTGAWLVPVLFDRVPDVGYLTRDPTSVAHAPWWYGVVSRLTNLFWAATATVNVMAGLVATGRTRWLLLLLGALVSALTLDDTLLLHDAVLPGRGILEGVVLLAYVAAALALAVLWWPQRRSPSGIAFFAGAAVLGVSVGLDDMYDKHFILEDGTKLLGITAWAFCGAWAFTDGLRRLGQSPAHTVPPGLEDDHR